MYTIIYVGFVLTKEVFLGVLVFVLNPWGLLGYFRFELSYAKPQEGISGNLMWCL